MSQSGDMSHYVGWIMFCSGMAAAPWAGAAMFGKLRRITLAQIALMILLLAFGFAAPRLRLDSFYIAFGMLVGSACVITLGPEE